MTRHGLIKSAQDPLHGLIDLDQHASRASEDVTVRDTRCMLAPTATIRHNHTTTQPVMRSLIAYDH